MSENVAEMDENSGTASLFALCGHAVGRTGNCEEPTVVEINGRRLCTDHAVTVFGNVLMAAGRKEDAVKLWMAFEPS